MKNRNATKYKSTIQEKGVAKDLNTKPTVASGSLWFQKADVRSEDFLVECKTTSKSYYPLTVATWKKINSQAIKDNLRTPLMCVDLEDGKSSIAIISINDFIAYEFDTHAQYLGNPEPILTEAKSFRVTSDFIGADFPQSPDPNQYPCYRMDVKFVDHNLHLVMIPWKDFINIQNLMNR